MKKLFDAAAAAARAFRQRYNDKGEEIPDPRPVEVPLHFRRPPDLHEMVRRAVMSESWSRRMAEQGLETEEEANDFDVGDGDDPDDSFARAEVAYQMAEDFPREKERVQEAGKALEEARRKRQRGPDMTAGKTQAADSVKPGSNVSLSQDE